KGMKWREEKKPKHWSVPYLAIDPHDIGREYEGDIIRIYSQSGKSGIGYVLQQNYGLELPAQMRESFGYRVKDVSDRQQKELQPDEIFAIFKEDYVNLQKPIRFIRFVSNGNGNYETKVTVEINGETREITGE